MGDLGDHWCMDGVHKRSSVSVGMSVIWDNIDGSYSLGNTKSLSIIDRYIIHFSMASESHLVRDGQHGHMSERLGHMRDERMRGQLGSSSIERWLGREHGLLGRPKRGGQPNQRGMEGWRGPMRRRRWRRMQRRTIQEM